MPEPSQPELWDGNEISEILLAFGIAIPMKLWHCVVLKEVRQLDEKLLDLLDMALAERFQLSYAALRESDPQSEKLVQELMSLSDSIQNSFEISQGIKDRIELNHLNRLKSRQKSCKTVQPILHSREFPPSHKLVNHFRLFLDHCLP